MTTLVLHGAGSTGDAARRLLGLGKREDVIALENRSGDIDDYRAQLDTAVRDTATPSEIIGVSLGAHAVVRWAAGADPVTGWPGIRLTLVLPAWTGSTGNGGWATRLAAEQVFAIGADAALAAMRATDEAPDLVDLIEMAWAVYSEDELRTCLRTAGLGSGPSADELGAVPNPVRIIGWYADAFHPADVAIDWSRCIPHARLGMAARPSVDLLQAALGSINWPAAGQVRPPAAGA